MARIVGRGWNSGIPLNLGVFLCILIHLLLGFEPYTSSRPKYALDVSLCARHHPPLGSRSLPAGPMKDKHIYNFEMRISATSGAETSDETSVRHKFDPNLPTDDLSFGTMST